MERSCSAVAYDCNPPLAGVFHKNVAREPNFPYWSDCRAVLCCRYLLSIRKDLMQRSGVTAELLDGGALRIAGEILARHLQSHPHRACCRRAEMLAHNIA